MAQQAPAEPAAPRVAAPIVATVAVTKAARAMFFVMLTALVAYQFQSTYGTDPAETQFLVSLATFAGLLRPLLAYWGDVRPLGMHRRKNFMTLGNVLFVAAIAILLAMPNPSLSVGYLVVLVAVVAYGLGEAFIDVSTDALLLDVATTPAEKSRVQGFARTGAVAGSLAAYGLATALMGTGWPVLLACIAGTIVLGTALTFRIQEPPVTRGQVLERIARERPTIPRGYKAVLWIAGATFAVVSASEGLVNVQLEPWLIGKYGNLPDIFFAVELASAAIALAALVSIVASLRRRTWNVAVLIIPAGAFEALFYVALPWAAPDIGAFAAWNTAKGICSVLAGLAIERALMDVVKGARKGATFQFFVLFMVGGSFAGQVIGSVLGDLVGMDVLMVLAGCVMAAGVALYTAVLAPRLKET